MHDLEEDLHEVEREPADVGREPISQLLQAHTAWTRGRPAGARRMIMKCQWRTGNTHSVRKFSSVNRCARAPHSAYAAGVEVAAANLLADPFVWAAPLELAAA